MWKVGQGTAVGVSDTSTNTVGHRLKIRLLADIEAEAKEQQKGFVVPAIQRLKQLVEGAQSESVQLGAINHVLDRARLKPVVRQQVEQVNNIENLSDEELQAEIDNLYLKKFGMTQTELKKAVKGQH